MGLPSHPEKWVGVAMALAFVADDRHVIVAMSDELREPVQPEPPSEQQSKRESPETRRRTLLHLADLRELQDRARAVADRLAKLTPPARSADPTS